jgi:hypothetical protein
VTVIGNAEMGDAVAAVVGVLVGGWVGVACAVGAVVGVEVVTAAVAGLACVGAAVRAGVEVAPDWQPTSTATARRAPIAEAWKDPFLMRVEGVNGPVSRMVRSLSHEGKWHDHGSGDRTSDADQYEHRSP